VAFKTRRVFVRRKSSWLLKAKITGLDNEFQPLKGILINKTDADRAKKELLMAFDWLLEEPNESDAVTGIKLAALANVMQRPNLILCRCPVRAAIDNDCVVSMNSGKLTMKPVKGAKPGERDARLELIVSSRVHEPWAYVFDDGALIGAAVPPQLSMVLDPEMGELRSAVEVHDTLENLKTLIQKNIKAMDNTVTIFADTTKARFRRGPITYTTPFLWRYLTLRRPIGLRHAKECARLVCWDSRMQVRMQFAD
jgi:hypothetical protein